jgi:ferredoxin
MCGSEYIKPCASFQINRHDFFVLPRGEVNVPVKVQINAGSCQGHGRCYDIAADLFGEDDEGYGTVTGDGTVPQGREDDARLAAANCPEQAIEMIGEA